MKDKDTKMMMFPSGERKQYIKKGSRKPPDLIRLVNIKEECGLIDNHERPDQQMLETTVYYYHFLKCELSSTN